MKLKQTTKLFVVSILVSLSSCISLYAKDDIELIPEFNWKVGDTWKLRAVGAVGLISSTGETKPLAIEVLFEVKRTLFINDFESPHKSIEELHTEEKKRMQLERKYECFEVYVSFPKEEEKIDADTRLYGKLGPKPFGTKYRYWLYVRKDTMNLIRIVDRTIVRGFGEVCKNRIRDFTIEPCGPVIIGNFAIIPLDWPDFQKSDIDKKINSGRMWLQENTIESYKTREGELRDRVKIEIKKENKDGKVLERTELKWKRGDPWWTSVKTYNQAGEVKQTTEYLEPDTQR